MLIQFSICGKKANTCALTQGLRLWQNQCPMSIAPCRLEDSNFELYHQLQRVAWDPQPSLHRSHWCIRKSFHLPWWLCCHLFRKETKMILCCLCCPYRQCCPFHCFRHCCLLTWSRSMCLSCPQVPQRRHPPHQAPELRLLWRATSTVSSSFFEYWRFVGMVPVLED